MKQIPKELTIGDDFEIEVQISPIETFTYSGMVLAYTDEMITILTTDSANHQPNVEREVDLPLKNVVSVEII